jgi:membrane protease YdiL (CAAX protease family)
VTTSHQLKVFLILVIFLAVLAFLTYAFFFAQATAGLPVAMPALTMPLWVYGAAEAGIILLAYGLLGLAGFWFARKMGWPGFYREGAGWRDLFWQPMGIGFLAGLSILAGDALISTMGGMPRFPHPAFPFSIIASASAGIGEEIIFRCFVMGLWAFLFNLLLKRWNATPLAFWIGNLVGAIAFAASHIPSVLFLLNVSSPAAIPPLMLVEIFLLNGILGLLAGERMIKNGLIAAIGIHFWADILWHVMWPLAGMH